MLCAITAASSPAAALLRCGRATRAPKAAPQRCVSMAKSPASGPGGSSGPKKTPPPTSRGPGAAPLRMQTDDQRKFGYGGDNYDGGGRGDGDRWQPGGSDDGANPVGLAILVACGLWAYFEYKRPGGRLNPNAAQYKAQQDAEARRKRKSEAVRLS